MKSINELLNTMSEWNFDQMYTSQVNVMSHENKHQQLKENSLIHCKTQMVAL